MGGNESLEPMYDLTTEEMAELDAEQREAFEDRLAVEEGHEDEQT